MERAPVLIAFDFGGSSLKLIASAACNERAPWKEAIYDYPGSLRTATGGIDLRRSMRWAASLVPQLELESYGICFAGQPDEAGRVLKAGRLGWCGADLRGAAEEIFRRAPSVILSDAAAATRCARRDCASPNALAWILGSGLGGELWIEGQSYCRVGTGHIETAMGRPCRLCGQSRCLEAAVNEPRADQAARLLEGLAEWERRVDRSLALWLGGGRAATLAPALRKALGDRFVESPSGRMAAAQGLLLSLKAS